MELTDAITKRVSIRTYQPTPIPRSLITDLIHAAHLAPSAGNLQAREFIAVDDQRQKEALAQAAYGQTFIAQAACDIVVCADTRRIASYGPRGTHLYMIQDAAAAIEALLLLATDQGLGSCWVGAFNDRHVADALNLPAHLVPQAIVPIGTPAEPGRPHQRRRLQIHWNTWTENTE